MGVLQRRRWAACAPKRCNTQRTLSNFSITWTTPPPPLLSLTSLSFAARVGAGNTRVYVGAENSDGLRLTPRYFVEEQKKSSFMKEAFFGPDTIEGWHLKQLTAKAAALVTVRPPAGKEDKGGIDVTGDVSRGPAAEALVQAAAEFNANVPVTGANLETEKDKVVRSVGPLLAILDALAGHTNRAPDVGRIRELAGYSVTLLQALLRLTLTAQGQKLIPKIDDVNGIFLRLLQCKEPFVAYWAVQVLSAAIRCPLPSGNRNTKQEYENKQLLLSNSLNGALVALLNDDKVAMLVKKTRDGSVKEEKTPEELAAQKSAAFEGKV